MAFIARLRFVFPLAAALTTAFAGGAHAATDCSGLAKALGPNLPIAVPGSFQGTRCGNLYAQTPQGTWNIPFLLRVKGDVVTYVTYRFFEAIVVTPNDVKGAGPSLTFNIPLTTLNGPGFEGTVSFTFTQLPNGEIDTKVLSAVTNGARVSFVSRPKLAPFLPTQSVQTHK